MTLAFPISGDAGAVHFLEESFHIAARSELAAHPLSPFGVCLNPLCSRNFQPSREWHRYCSVFCSQTSQQEMRRVGQKVAPALLAWRLGKYAPKGSDLKNLSSAGLSYVSRVQSEWLMDRQRRMATAGEQMANFSKEQVG